MFAELGFTTEDTEDIPVITAVQSKRRFPSV
jgi:hypothetical protein